MTVLRDLLAELPWPTLQPAHERLRDQPTAWAQRAVFALTADRRVGLAYTPVSRPIALDMSGFASPVRATWLNPATGQRTAVSALANSGVQRLVPPTGGDDWVLILQP